jgi:hypothetical protein
MLTKPQNMSASINALSADILNCTYFWLVRYTVK